VTDKIIKSQAILGPLGLTRAATLHIDDHSASIANSKGGVAFWGEAVAHARAIGREAARAPQSGTPMAPPWAGLVPPTPLALTPEPAEVPATFARAPNDGESVVAWLTAIVGPQMPALRERALANVQEGKDAQAWAYLAQAAGWELSPAAAAPASPEGSLPIPESTESAA
jgi:hypothetical protein